MTVCRSSSESSKVPVWPSTPSRGDDRSRSGSSLGPRGKAIERADRADRTAVKQNSLLSERKKNVERSLLASG